MPSAPHSLRALLVALVLAAPLAPGAPIGAQGVEGEPAPERSEQEAREAAEKLAETLALAPDAPPSPDDPFAALVEATDEVARRALVRLDATAKSQVANAAAARAVDALEEAIAGERDARRARDRASAEATAERQRLKDLTVKAFVNGGEDQLDEYRSFVEGDTTDPVAGRRIMFAQVLRRQETVTERAQRDLADARAALRIATEERVEAEGRASAAIRRASEATRMRVDAEAAHLEALAARDDAEAALRSGARSSRGGVPLEVPLIGMPRLSADDLATWFEAGPWRPRIATPIADLARWFIEEGRTEGIRGDIAFAQAVLETGGFANTDSVVGNNYSGIGHYDDVALGFLFPSPQLGVRAQIQLLKSYAVRTPAYVHPLVDRRLRGPAGCCQTWGDLTTVWATDPTYGPKVMMLYTSLVDHALDRRARGEGFGPEAP